MKKLIAYEEKVISQRNAHVTKAIIKYMITLDIELHSLIGDDADHASTITTTVLLSSEALFIFFFTCFFS